MHRSFPLVPVLFLVLGAIVEALYFAARRFGTGNRCLVAARLAAWFMRPVMAAAGMNLWFCLTGALFSDEHGYPFYAVRWFGPQAPFPTWFSMMSEGQGIPLWLPLAALGALALAGCAAAVRSLPESCLRTLPLSGILAGLVALSFGFFVAIGGIPRGIYTDEGQNGSFPAPWHESGTTMLYASHYMRPDAANYLRQFDLLQKRLDHVIHAKSHPPFASLCLRWIGSAAGVDVGNYKHYLWPESRLRYALGQTFVSTWNLVLVFFLGAVLFGRRVGLFGSVLWASAPSVGHYATFAPDMNYALFFHGAFLFSWLVAMAPDRKRALAYAVPLGLCFGMLVLMTFSWCIATAFFAVFCLLANFRAKRTLREAAWRIVPPLAVMVLASGALILAYHIKYFDIYRNSSRYVAAFYPHHSLAESALALVGGQVEWLVLLGPLVCTGFFMALAEDWRSSERTFHALYATVLLAILALPFVFGPTALKHETARCWIWVAAVPVVFSARYWMDRESAFLCGVVAFSSTALCVLLRLFSSSPADDPANGQPPPNQAQPAPSPRRPANPPRFHKKLPGFKRDCPPAPPAL